LTIMASNILYIPPKPNFFSQANGVGGHVAHVYGIVNGFGKLGYDLDVISEESHPTIDNNKTRLHIRPIGRYSFLKRQVWGLGLIRLVRSIVLKRSPLFCYVRYSVGFTPVLPLLERALGDIPLVLEVNSFGTQHYRFLRGIDFLALRSADVIICVSETVRNLMLKKVSSGLSSKILVMPNGIDIDRFEKAEPDTEMEPLGQKIRLGYAGILKPDYGFEELFNACSIISQQRKDVSLHIYGDGPYREELEKEAALLDCVFLHGAKSFFEMPGVLKSTDILIYTSSHNHKFQSPIKLYEYMAVKKPIVAAATPQVKELLGKEERGLLYPIGGAETLAQKIMMLIKDRELGKSLAEKAFVEVKKNHTWAKRIELLFDALYDKGLIKEQRSRLL
ncbi:MAG: glycosyltransferase family 4 protein, partial [Armatimonadetes bacterium]|nr:glycosyltransferase family 4 protein [Armatimonadota bacterium]